MEHWIQRDSTVYLTSPGEIVQRLQTHALAIRMAWRPFGLFDASGRFIAGNLPVLPQKPVPVGQYFEYTLLSAMARTRHFEASGYRMANDDILIISYNVNEIYGFKHLLLDAMAWGGIMVFGSVSPEPSLRVSGPYDRSTVSRAPSSGS